MSTLNDFFNESELTTKDRETALDVFNANFSENKIDVDLPLYQCVSCKKLIELTKGDCKCKYCGKGVYWGEV
jgi:rRNA maturation endonuclease Nob1